MLSTKRNNKRVTVKDLNQAQKQAVQNIKSYKDNPNEVQKLLDFMSQFYNYSFNNVVLIRKQWPSATVVDSYAGWKRRGFPVKKGEKAQIKVIIPATVTLFKHDDKVKSLHYATKKERQLIKDGQINTHRKLYFKTGSVFEMSQTTAKPKDFPELYPNRHINYDIDAKAYHKILMGLVKCLKDLGLKLTIPDNNKLMGNAKGFYLNNSLIALSQYNTKGEMLTVLMHELGHAYIKQDKLSRNYAEMEAEMVAYLVSKHYGIDTSKKAIKYISDWTNNLKDVSTKDLHTLLRETQRASLDIINNIDK